MQNTGARRVNKFDFHYNLTFMASSRIGNIYLITVGDEIFS